MLVVKPMMVVASLINLNVTLLIMSAKVVNPMMTALQIKPIVMLMVHAKIVDSKGIMELAVLVELLMMVLLVLLKPTITVIPYMVSVLIFVFKILIVLRLVHLTANLNVVVVWNVIKIPTALLPNGEELRKHSRPCVTREWVTNVFTLLLVPLILIALLLAALPVHTQRTNVLNAALTHIVLGMLTQQWPVM